MSSFQESRRPRRFINKLWKEYVWEKQTISQLSKRYSKSKSFIRGKIDSAEVEQAEHFPQKLHATADVVFFGRGYGVIVFRSPKLKKNLCWAGVERETPFAYAPGRKHLEDLGYGITSMTIDGKRGVLGVFKGIPVQICQFHQMRIITRYLTRRPKLEAGKELRSIVLTLSKSNEKYFTEQLNVWHEKWQNFLKEKTIDPITGRWHFTHKRLMSAYRSLKTNLPYLFTCQKHPELNISNTTNSLDGSFSHLKTLLRIHRGQTIERRKKMIDEILKNRPDSRNPA